MLRDFGESKMDSQTPGPPTLSTPIKAPTSARKLTSHYSNTSLFGADAKVKLQGLALASQNPNDFKPDVQGRDSSPEEQDVPVVKPVISEVMSCNWCQAQFDDREEQIAHYSSDWHRYNLRLRLKGLKGVSEEEFEIVSGDVSSISGSDNDTDNETTESTNLPSKHVSDSVIDHDDEDSYESSTVRGKRYDKIYFKNDQGELISLYKCLFSHKKSPVTSTSDVLAVAGQLVDQPKWAVLMVSSGHFAGAIFNGKNVVKHKTFHRYTVRQKRGSAQSTRDNQGNAPKSGGASLRRYNEAALAQEVQELMKSWQSSLESCNLIFVRIPVGNRGMFYGGKNPALKKDDLRIRIIPIPTRRPTLNEVKRVQQMLSCIECFGQESDVGDFVPLSPPRMYCKDKDELEVRPPNPNPRPKKYQESPPSPENKEDVKAEEDLVKEEESEEDEFELDSPGPGNPLKEFEVFVEKKKRRRKKTGKSKASKEVSKADEDEVLLPLKNSLFTACKTGNVDDLRKSIGDLCIYFNPVKPQSADDHTSKIEASTQNGDLEKPSKVTKTDKIATVDEGKNSSVETKIAIVLSGAFGDKANTLLHIASQENRYKVMTVLLQEGADPSIKNKGGMVPYQLGDTEVKNTFRRFMALFPEKYDYKTAQIPSPLTAEMEAAKKKKNSERRAAQKKSAQERNKVKKEEEMKQREEREVKERFLNLSDREKRALAAERRILQQHNDQVSPRPVLSRCFQCAGDMTGKVPFEYSDYKFCSTKCLREHRSKPKS